MSYFNPVHKIIKFEFVDFVVPERLRSARAYRGLSQEQASILLGIPQQLLGLYENGHKDIPKELLMGLEKLYGFPKGYFYKVRWERV
jgi:transcriptional regulator with XRE-family HTH domain